MKNKIKFKSEEVSLAYEFIKEGILAPEISLTKGDLSQFNSTSIKGKNLILNIFPSLDTEVCATSVRKFNEIASKIKDTLVLCISKDLPFAQSRFCTTQDINDVMALSAYKCSNTFGKDYGVLIKDGALECLFARAIIVIDKNGKVIYAHLNEEITQEPNYDKALKTLSIK